MIELSHISKTFAGADETVHAVNDVSLTIQTGDIYGIIGFSGAGKSTLVRCMNLLERPDSGTVTIDGCRITELSAGELRRKRRKIGMIFQHFNLMASRTVVGNVAYPLLCSGYSKKEAAAKTEELLELVGIADKKNVYPGQLSGGQKQRVAIARALANDPTILLCDEATSALDPQTTHSILALLKMLNEKLGITIVLITHEMEVIKEACSHVAVMELGKVVEQGSVLEIFSNPQQKITRDFIRSTSNLSRIEALISAGESITDVKSNELIIRLSYTPENTSEPLVSAISRNYGVDVNIIFANIELIQGTVVGGTVAILRGETEKLNPALEYLQSKGVGVEVLKDGRTD